MSSSRRSKSRRARKIAANLFVGLLALITILLLVGLFLPRRYRVARHTEIRATPQVIFADLANLRRWPEWTVWNTDMDPTVQFQFDSPDTGPGAVYRWAGEKLGKGELKLTEANPTNGVAYVLQFEGGTAEGSIDMTLQGDSVRVDWVNQGDVGKSPVGRYFALFMDSMLGEQMEQGLARLKTRAETASQ